MKQIVVPYYVQNLKEMAKATVCWRRASTWFLTAMVLSDAISIALSLTAGLSFFSTRTVQIISVLAGCCTALALVLHILYTYDIAMSHSKVQAMNVLLQQFGISAIPDITGDVEADPGAAPGSPGMSPVQGLQSLSPLSPMGTLYDSENSGRVELAVVGRN